jgi:hypothetical protein
MKKAILMIVVSGLVLLTMIAWWISSGSVLSEMGIVIGISILIIVAIMLLESRKRIKEAKLNLPSDDELTKVADFKAGYYSYLISVYIWLILYFVKDLLPTRTHILAIGIILMAVVFLVARMIFRRRSRI